VKLMLQPRVLTNEMLVVVKVELRFHF
jgi:hypothetical protein